ncbi:unnamed protein product [Bemisia tabaci]|uniref:Uncharacterized protein n=1 Tax=Bemisia tabaci TaxID=7038 RepID=A0A9P0ANV8_BEMTA|nr:unnamed protein product [Bemisia tabaci]
MRVPSRFTRVANKRLRVTQVHEFKVIGILEHDVGDVFMMEGIGRVFFIEKNVAAYVRKRGKSDKFTTVDKINVSNPSHHYWRAQVIKFEYTLPPDHTAEILRRLLGRKLPYAYFSCNEEHYMDYFLSGEPRLSFYLPCLQRRSLSSVPYKEIKSFGFYLQDMRNKKVKVINIDFETDSEESVNVDSSE